jgi:hypothetical protein
MIFGTSDVPDPRSVVYPETTEPKFVAWATTKSAARLYPVHEHCVFINSATGEGATSVVASHFHRVRNGVILPDESDGHTHSVSRLPCGAG